MRNQSFDDIFLQAQSKVQVRPRLVTVFENRETEDKVVKIFEVMFPLALVAHAEDHVVNLDPRQGHVVGSARHHLRQIIGGLLGLATLRPAKSELLLFIASARAVTRQRPLRGLLCKSADTVTRFLL